MPRRLSNMWIVPIAAATMIVLYAIDHAASRQADARATAEGDGAAACGTAGRTQPTRGGETRPRVQPTQEIGHRPC